MPIAVSRVSRALALALLLAPGCSPPSAPAASPAPAAASASTPAAPEPSATPQPAASASPPPSSPPPVADPPPIVIRRSEIYAMVVFRAGKALTVTSLLTTSESPPPLDAPAVLFLKTSDDAWIEVASVTLKKLLPGGKIQVHIDEERAGAPTAKAFRKNANVKLQIDQVTP